MAVSQSKRTVLVTPVYKENWEALVDGEKRYIVNEGGTRSGKTYSIMQVLVTYASHNPNTRITVCSHSLPHLKRGAMRDFVTIAMGWGVYQESNHHKTDSVYHFPNNSFIEFIGLEEAEKARGSSRDILFVNEANLINKKLFDQLDMRTSWKVIIDLNPSDFDVWCYQVADGDEAVKIHSTYKNNITNLPSKQVEVIESYKDADPLMWQVFGLGLRGTSQDQVYTHYQITDQLPGKSCYYGLDFGYNVSTALVRVETYEGANYVQEVLYQTKMTTGDLIQRLKSLKIDFKDEIFADAAEPKAIEELNRAGFLVRAADKDVTEGIRKVKSMPLYITRESQNVLNELRNYKWKVDKNGKTLDEPDKAAGNDHSLDAMRYAIFTKNLAFKFKVLVA